MLEMTTARSAIKTSRRFLILCAVPSLLTPDLIRELT